MVAYGFSPMQATVSATKISAETCKVDHITGTFEQGKWADLHVHRENPLDNISILSEPEAFLLIVKEGKICVDRRYRGIITIQISPTKKDSMNWFQGSLVDINKTFYNKAFHIVRGFSAIFLI